MVATDDRHDSRCRESDGERVADICSVICGVTCCTMLETEARRTAGVVSRRSARCYPRATTITMDTRNTGDGSRPRAVKNTSTSESRGCVGREEARSSSRRLLNVRASARVPDEPTNEPNRTEPNGHAEERREERRTQRARERAVRETAGETLLPNPV